MSVLFADVVGSTHLAGSVDPEELRDRIVRFFSIVREQIEAHGGSLEKFIGDAVMAVFGLPTVHEDDAVRAVQAALAIRAQLRPHIAAGLLPGIRIGVSTGEVVADPLAAAHGQFMVTGEVVNLAARLQQSAPAGAIFVSEATHAATQQAFEYRRLPDLQVKGWREPVTPYECLGLRARPLPRSILLPGVAPLVGRREELAILLNRLERLRDGTGGIVFLLGEPGMGKSRLIAETRERTAGWEVRWLEGRALSFGRTVSYWPFLEIIRSGVGLDEGEGGAEGWARLHARVASLAPAQTEEIAPYLGTLLGVELPAPWRERVLYLDAVALGRQIYRSTRLFFTALAQERPLVLVFEDLHWIDQSSAELLEHLYPLVTRLPLLLCCLTRTEAGDSAGRLREVAGRRYGDSHAEIRLSPLPPVESRELVRHLLRQDEASGRWSELILHKAEGNPFFVEEIVRTLIAVGAVPRDGLAADVPAAVRPITLPDTLRGVIMARVDRLGEEAKQVLKVAAVIGRSFHETVLRAVVGDGAALDRALLDLQRMEFIQEKGRRPEQEYSFRHVLTQEAVYESTLLRQRRDLHRRVAQAVEEIFAERPAEFHALLAFHYARAGEREKALEALLRAGDQAGRIAADAEALAHYQEAAATYAQAFGEEWDPRERAVVERKIGQALFRRGQHHQAVEHFYRALARQGITFPATRRAVRAALGRELLRQAWHRLAPPLVPQRPFDAEAQERSHLFDALAWIYFYTDPERLALVVVAGLNLAEEYRFEEGTVRALMGVGLFFDLLGRFRLARSYHRRAVALAERLQHPIMLGVSYLGMGLHLRHGHGRLQEALDLYRKSAAAYRQAGELRQWGAVSMLAAWVERTLGHIEESLATSAVLLRVGQEAGDAQLQGWGLRETGRTLLQQGALDEAARHLQAAGDFFAGIPDYRSILLSTSGLAQCRLRQGQPEEALRLLKEAEQLIGRTGLRGYPRTQVYLGLAEVALAQVEQSRGTDRSAWLRGARAAGRAAVAAGRVDFEARPGAYRAQGTLQWLEGRRATAEVWWRRSLAAAEQMGAPYEVGRTCLEMGRLMGERLQLQRARTIFADLGARWDLVQAEAPAHPLA